MNPSLSGGKKLLQSNYERPSKTITETLQSKKDIEEQLNGFDEISNDDLCYTTIGTYLRYLSYDPKTRKELYRFGGLLVKVEREYVVLAGKEGMRFSVQRYTKDNNGNIIHKTRFFKKIKEEQTIKKQYNDYKSKTDEVLIKQQEIINKQKQEIKDMKKLFKKT